MEPWLLVVANVLGGAVMFGGIALCVRFDQRGKTRRRELEHAERMRAIELGRPLDDAEVARVKALGAVGVAAPIAAMSAAVVGSLFAYSIGEPVWRFAALAVIWGVCGLVVLAAVPAVVARLKGRPPRERDGPPVP
ncbi:MAG: hypothetical protein K2X87_31460 [Gemmataceae bacterium]|nr:hypothetical protein [Gemmataceae bacterium]